MGPSQVDSTRASQVGQNPVKICFLGFLSPETLEYVGVMGMGFIQSDSSFFGFNTTPNGFQNVPDGGSRAKRIFRGDDLDDVGRSRRANLFATNVNGK